jgi:hypothetical protein
MSTKSYLFVANWKMYFSADQTMEFCQNHMNDLAELAANMGH